MLSRGRPKACLAVLIVLCDRFFWQWEIKYGRSYRVG